MYTLYYYNEAYNVSTIEVETLTQPVSCPENLFFIGLRKGKTFITEPHECIKFTSLERLFIRSFGLTSFAFKNEKNSNFRMQNSLLDASTCAEGEDGEKECCCGEETDPEPPIEEFTFEDLSIDQNGIVNNVSLICSYSCPSGFILRVTHVASGNSFNVHDLEVSPVVSVISDLQFGYGNYVFELYDSSFNPLETNTILYRYQFDGSGLLYINDGYFGNRTCEDGLISISNKLISNYYISTFDPALIVGSELRNRSTGAYYTGSMFLWRSVSNKYLVIEDGIVTEILDADTTCIALRTLIEVQVNGVLGDGVISLQYILADGTPVIQTWTVGGSGEVLDHTFPVAAEIQEASVGIDAGTIVSINWAP
jgi:hypothetical protein